MTCWGSQGKRGILVGPERMNRICTDAEEERRGECNGMCMGWRKQGRRHGQGAASRPALL